MSSGSSIAAAPPESAATSRNKREYFVLFGLPIGLPQIIAGLMLLAFLGQCLWLAVHSPLREMELAQVQQGQAFFSQTMVPADSAHSPLTALLVGVAVGFHSDALEGERAPAMTRAPRAWRWRARLPFIAIGLLLGASLWYVARRLYGNTGGYIALVLYAFSPDIILRAANVHPTIVAAWGAFGAVFTAIAVSHTLYAPREVVLWNWKRILLLGLSLALAAGSQFALALMAALALGFMLYLASERRGAALTIFAAAGAVFVVLLCAFYRFDLHALAASVGGINTRDFAPHLLVRPLTYNLVAIFLMRMPGVLVMLAAALVAFVAWRRTRFFGTAAPLLVWAVVMLLGITVPHLGGYNLFVVALPFAFVFIAGVFTDLLETRYSSLVLGVLAGVLLTHVVFNVGALFRVR
ncbi:MAG: hypothetical protein ACR2IF_11230 [Terriglobales bacterium]